MQDIIPAFLKSVMLPFFDIPQRISYKHLRIPGNVLFRAGCIHCRIFHKGLHIFCIFPWLYRCQGSLTVRRHNKALRIPCLIECSLPSFLHFLPVCRSWRSDYKWLHTVGRHQYKFYRYGIRSLFWVLISKIEIQKLYHSIHIFKQKL